MPRIRLLFKLAVLVPLTGVLLAGISTMSRRRRRNAAGTVHTDSGAAVNMRSTPHTTATVVGSMANGASVTIDCQTHGDTVTGKYGTSDIWDKVRPSGYITDTYVYTGSDGTVAPACGGGTADLLGSTSATRTPARRRSPGPRTT